MNAVISDKLPSVSELSADETAQPIRILVVEDEDALRSILASVLTAQGYRVYQADRKQSALRQLEKISDIAVMLVDLGLPPLANTTAEGLAVVRHASENYPATKVIVLTGQDQEQAALETIREGAFDFLSKPAHTTQILAAIDRAQLFHRKERAMASEGVTRLQFNAKISNGLKAVREDAEEKLIRQVLKDTSFNVYKSAARLGVKRESIYYFMKKFGIDREHG